MDQLPEPAHLPATQLLVPEEGQDTPSHPLTIAAKSGLLQLTPAKAAVEMYHKVFSLLKKILEHRLKHQQIPKFYITIRSLNFI